MKFLLTLLLFLAAAVSLASADQPLIPFDIPIQVTPEDLNDFGELIKLASAKGAKSSDISSLDKTPKLPVSPECLTTLLGIVVSPEFTKCMPISAFTPLLKLLDPNFVKELLKDPLKNVPPLFGPVFDGWCPAPKCSQDFIAQSLKSVQTGCKADIDKPLIKVTIAFIALYSPIRDSVCFKNEDKVYCVFETMQKVFTLPPAQFPITKDPLIDSVVVANPVTVCTACNKAILNTFLNYLKADSVALGIFLQMFNLGESGIAFIHLGVSAKCGQQFDDGKVGDPTKDGGLCSTAPKSQVESAEQQLSLPQDIPNPLGSGATSIKGISLLMMMGSLLVSTFFMI